MSHAVRADLINLKPDARKRVREQIAAKGGHCECCGATGFDVGGALFLGFLFHDSDRDAYMVALTCRNPDCAKPRSGIILRKNDFMESESADLGAP